MAKQRHIGFVIFGACCALSARIAIFEPQPHELTPAEERWGTRQTDDSDPLGLIHGLRYYIYGVGVVGLLMVVEDYYSEKSRKRKGPDKPQTPPKDKDDETKPDA
jgi:mannose/fructose/N-acetylgalactosamine-specific phosphotransferase system component IIC